MGGITLLLIILGIVRAAGLVSAVPVTGYASQEDMAQTASCVGLWPNTAETPPPIQREAPWDEYRWGGRDELLCYPSSEILLVRAAKLLAGGEPGSTLDARYLGGVKLALLILSALLIHISLRRDSIAALLHAATFALVICDPFNLLFANRMSGEFSALLGLYIVLATASSALLRDRFSIGLSLLWLLGIGLLGGSSMQHVALPLALTIVSFLALRQRSGSLFVTSLIIAGMLMFMQLGLQQKSSQTEDANRINALFHTVLPASKDSRTFAFRLGLTDKCPELTHTSSERTRGRNHREDCPEAFDLSKLRISWVLATEPVTNLGLYLRALHQSGAWRLSYLGEVAGGEFETLDTPFGWSITRLIQGMPFWLYVLFYTIPLWAGLASIAWLFSARHAEHPGMRSLFLGQALLSLVIVMVFGSALLDVGFVEFSRDIHLANNACAAAWLLIPCLVVAIIRQDRLYQLSFIQMRSLVLWAGVAIVFAFSFVFPREFSLGQGQLDAPLAETNEDRLIQASGWAMSPDGIRRVEAVTGEGLRYPLAHRPDPALHERYPIGESPVRFEGEFQLGETPSGMLFDIVVTGQEGQESVIDSRWMTVQAPVEAIQATEAGDAN